MSIQRIELENFFNTFFNPGLFDDYCPNGLQVEGSEEIKRIAFALSATRDSILKAAESGADTLIVHHGIIWKYQNGKTITGPFHKRIAPLIINNMNLFGMHLPLDAHFEIGNAACIAKKLPLINLEPFAPYKRMPIGVKGQFEKPLKAKDLQELLKKILNHDVIISTPDKENLIRNIGIITGGASSSFIEAVNDRLDSYLTGEISEHAWTDSQEAGITMFAGGHTATETFGILELEKKIKETFQVETFFIPSENPV